MTKERFSNYNSVWLTEIIINIFDVQIYVENYSRIKTISS